MKQMLQKMTLRRTAVMLLGIVLLALGIALFKLSRMGNDPSTAQVIAIADCAGVDFSVMMLAANCVWFLAELLCGRHMIGAGTLVNWFGVGPLASVFVGALEPVFRTQGEGTLGVRLALMALGMLIVSLGASMYQKADVGIAPYDSLALILDKWFTKIPYFWCRIFTDGVCALAAWALGGIVGLGTLVCALGLGPFITFFDKTVSDRLVGEKAE